MSTVSTSTIRRHPRLRMAALLSCGMVGALMLLGGCETRQVGEARYYFVDPDYGISPQLMSNSRRVAPTGVIQGYEPDRVPTRIERATNP